ncbi:MAG: hypothetical protein ACI835_001978, partial [Planctomycetota bacterium]
MDPPPTDPVTVEPSYSIVEPPASKKSGIWFRALRLSLAVALLAYVGSVLPWADHLDV